MDGRTQAQVNLRKTCLAVALIYALLVLGFYFLAGDQLRYKEAVELADALGYDLVWQKRR